MSGRYTLVASVFYRVEDGKRIRYKRGDTIELTESEVDRLTVGRPRYPAAFVSASSVPDGLAPGPELATAPVVLPPATGDEASAIVAERNTIGVAPAGEDDLKPDSEAVLAAKAAAAEAIAQLGGNGGSTTPTASGTERPAKAALHEVWVAYAVSKGIPEAEAQELTKAQIDERTR